MQTAINSYLEHHKDTHWKSRLMFGGIDPENSWLEEIRNNALGNSVAISDPNRMFVLRIISIMERLDKFPFAGFYE